MVLTRQHIPLLVATTVVGLLVGAGVRSCKGTQPEPSKPEIVHDTITVTEEDIKEKTSVRSVWKYDTAVIFLRDTIHDTVRVQIPIENKVYNDTLCIDSARVRLNILFHGYRAEIDRINLGADIRPTIRREIKRNGWGQFIGLGIGLGYGASVVNGSVYAAPEVGVHVTYGWGYHW